MLASFAVLLALLSGTAAQSSTLGVCPDARLAGRKTLSAKSHHVCAISANLSLTCRGAYGFDTAPAFPGLSFVAVSAGGGHACALATDGALHCWGSPSNNYGQASVPSDVASLTVASVSAGDWHTCVLFTSSSLRCWGGSVGQADVPANAATGQVLVVSGASYSCSVSIVGGVSCWGANDQGQTSVPAAVATSGQVSIGTGTNHACSLASSGGIQCWGNNACQQLDVPLAAQSGMVAVAPGSYHTCALSASGVPLCWGSGPVNVGQAIVPAEVSSNQVAITSGDFFTCSLSAAGSALCWGGNYDDLAIPVLPAVFATGVPLPCTLPFGFLTATPSPSSTPSRTPGLSCPPSFFRALPRLDLVGAPLTDTPLTSPSEGACRIACCDAPGCTGYVFAFTSCMLLANISSTAPNSFATSGLRTGVTLPSPPASASPAQTPLPAGGWPQRGGSVTPTLTPTGTNSSSPSPSLRPSIGQSLCFSENFDRLFDSGIANGVQYLTGLPVRYSCDLGGWAHYSGWHAIHAVARAEGGAALMIFDDDVVSTILLSSCSLAGHVYNLSFVFAPADYQIPSQSTNLGDSLLVRVVSEGAVVASEAFAPGVFSEVNVFRAGFLIYTATGGALTLQILSAAPNGDFAGAFDELIILDITSASPSPRPSPTPYCAPSLFRFLPRMDLVGVLVGSALAPGSVFPAASLAVCRQACCDAPACDGFSFATGDASLLPGGSGSAGCFLYVNITQLIPSSVVSSGIYESTL